MAAGAAAADGGGNGSGNGGGTGGAFACNICLQPAREAVIGRCGHLYCWPCLHQNGDPAPPSGAAPGARNPPGPSRTFQISFGFGAFPFPAPPPPPGGGGEPPSVDSVFLFVAAAFFLWLLSV